MPSETASLFLKSSDLTYGSTTSVGTADSNGTVLTWSNINLRVLLGDMYDKYDRFNLNLNTIATSVASSYTGSADERSTYITITGLPWVNNTYSISSSGVTTPNVYSNTNATVIASLFINGNAQTTQYFYGNNTSTFGKNQDIVNITISFLKVSDSTKPSPSAAYPKMIFIFDIEGIDDYKVKDITHTRILN
jgi:hypothetical protein